MGRSGTKGKSAAKEMNGNEEGAFAFGHVILVLQPYLTIKTWAGNFI